MGVGHSMNRDQVESVLSNFEDTMKAIKGIEQKADRVNEMLSETQRQQDHLHNQMDRGQEFVKNVTDSLNLRSSQVMHFRDSLEGIVEVVEKLEDTLYDLGLRDLPGKMQREFGPIFVPVLVLTLIVTVSNCAFGFLLATDAELALQGGTMNMVNVFATIHVVLIGLAVLHLVVEIVLKATRRRRRAAVPRDLLEKGGDDDAAELSAEEESPQPRPRANSDPGVVTVTSPGDGDGQVRASTAEQPSSPGVPSRTDSKLSPTRASSSQDARKSHKSVTSKETDSSQQGGSKRATSHEAQGASGLLPTRPKAAISGMLRAALQQGASLHSTDSRNSITPSENSGQQSDRIASALHAMRTRMEKVSGKGKGQDARERSPSPSFRRQGTASDVASEPGATPRAFSASDDGDDNHADGPSVGSI
jgi:hypothetical protein